MYSVKQQQTFLKHYYAYYKGAVDGISGSGTKAGIKLFQENHGLTADGIWGANTDAKAVEVTKKIQAALNSAIKSPSECEFVRTLETFVMDKGYDSKIAESIGDYVYKLIAKDALVVDGIFGEATKEAVEVYQRENGLDVDGVIGINTITKLIGKELATPVTVTDWSLYPNFSRDEFVCKCGGHYCNGDTAEMHTAVVDILQKIRNKYGIPIIVTSGVRCEQHNRNVDGTNSSRHKKGKAIDFYVQGCAVSGSQLVKDAYAFGCRYAYSIDGYAVHIDVY